MGRSKDLLVLKDLGQDLRQGERKVRMQTNGREVGGAWSRDEIQSALDVSEAQIPV